jgi:hypothetical protein
VNNATSTAETNYTASGVSYTQQDVSVSSRSLDLRRVGPATETLTITTRQWQASTSSTSTRWRKRSLWTRSFSTGRLPHVGRPVLRREATDDIPVTLEIRPVVNGYPASNQIVPCVAGSGLAM